MKKAVLLIAMLSLVVPSTARAHAATYSAPYQLGPSGGDSFNYISADASNGRMIVLRYQPAGISGGLGCGGQGGYANFKVAHAAEGATKVTVTYTDALIDPYTWLNVGVRSGGGFLASRVERGPILGSGSVTVTLAEPATADIEVWFGIQVASACPNVDGGVATFTSVAIDG